VGQLFVGDLVLADTVEELFKGLVLLPEDGLQLDVLKPDLIEYAGIEEAGAAETGLEVAGELPIDGGEKLVEIAKEDHLDPTERSVGVAVDPERFVDAVEDVRADHGDLVDDDGVEFPVEAGAFGVRADAARFDDLGWEAKKGMNGGAVDVEGRDAGGGEGGQPFLCRFAEVGEQGGFAGAGFPGDVDAGVGVLHAVDGLAEFIGDDEFGLFLAQDKVDERLHTG